MHDYEHEMREAFDALHDVMIIIGPDFTIQQINNRGLALIGVQREDAIGKKCHECLHGCDSPVPQCPLLAAAASGEAATLDTYEEKWDRYLSITCSPVRDTNGSITKYIDLIRDVTETKRANESLKRLGNLFNLALENGGLFVAAIAGDGACSLFKGEAVSRLGLTDDVSQYVSMYTIMTDLEQAVTQARSGTYTSFESRGLHGEKEWVIQNHLFPDSFDTGGIIHLGIDMSEIEQERKTARLRQKQLVQAEKLTSLGSLVAGIAHEINNPNMFMGMGADNVGVFVHEAMPVLEDYADRHPEWTIVGRSFAETREAVDRVLNGMKDGTRRINRIIRALKDFARPDHESPRGDVDVHKVIEDTVEILSNKIKNATSYFSFEPGIEVPCCRGNAQQIEQILMNLLTNACEALTTTKQRITVTTRHEPTTNTVRIEVADEGGGISADNLSRIAQPFFTTKQLSGGLGIGLSITYDLIESNNGTIHYESEPGVGTRAVVSFPAAPHGAVSVHNHGNKENER